MLSTLRLMLVAMLLAGLLLFGQRFSLSVQAATLTVTTTNPAVSADSECSLIEAILNANNDDQSGSVDCVAGSGDDVIDLNNLTILLSTSYADYNGATGLPEITSTMTLSNGGLDGDDSGFRFFAVNATGNLTLDDMTMRDGGKADFASNGGAIRVAGNGYLTITRSTFIHNEAYSGGAIHVESGQVSIEGTDFQFNHVADKGGAIFFQAGSLLMSGGRTQHNTASQGGAFYISDNFLCDNCVLYSNQATGEGGGIYTEAPVLLRGGQFNGHSAATGGAIYALADIAIVNARMTGNDASSNGGVLYTAFDANLTNVTLASNSSPDSGVIYNIPDNNPEITIANSIIYANESFAHDTTTITMDYTIIEGGYSGTANLDSDPLFQMPYSYTQAPFWGGDYRIQAGSPAIDSASNSLANAAGLDSSTAEWHRFLDDTGVPDTGEGTAPIIDRGAHEYWFTSCTNYDASNYTPYVVGTIHTVLADDLIAAMECARESVTEATFDLNNQTVYLTSGRSDDDGRVGLPPVDMRITLQNGTLHGSEERNDFRHLTVKPGGHLVLSNMSLQYGGYIDVGLNVPNDAGAIFNHGSLHITDSTFAHNATDGDGGVILSSEFGTVTIHNSTFTNNSAGVHGGAIVNKYNASMTITDSTFTGNFSSGLGFGGQGGAIQSYGSSTLDVTNSYFSLNEGRSGGAIRSSGPTNIIDSTFEDNMANSGAGVHFRETYSGQRDLRIENTLFDRNTASTAGGAISVVGSMDLVDSVIRHNTAMRAGGLSILSDATIINSLIVDNEATGGNGGGIELQNLNSLTLVNTTISHNTADQGGQQIHGVDQLVALNSIIYGNGLSLNLDPAITQDYQIEYSIVPGGYAGTGNLDVPPQFVDAANGDYRLSNGSPAIDSGSNTAATDAGIGTTDLDGQPRFSDDPYMLDTGEGTAPLINMGAYESVSTAAGLDVNKDGIISPTDAVYVINRLGSSNLTADVNGDNSITLDDLTAIQNALGN